MEELDLSFSRVEEDEDRMPATTERLAVSLPFNRLTNHYIIPDSLILDIVVLSMPSEKGRKASVLCDGSASNPDAGQV